MNLEELKKSLQYYYNNYKKVGVCVYAVLKGSEGCKPVKLNIDDNALDDLKEVFIESLKNNISNKYDLSLLSLSSSDERTNAIYIYDLELPSNLLSLERVTANDDFMVLNLKDESLRSIQALIIEIGDNKNQIVLYKTMASINIFNRSSFFLIKSKDRLSKVDDEFLRVSSGFQMLRIDGKLLILDLNSLERNFGFHDVIKKEAEIGVKSIESVNLIENPEVLYELLGDVKYARKFTKVAKSSPVLSLNIDNKTIINFCKNYPAISGRIRFNESKDKILLDTKVSKDLFIKLLMDDFLTSELTKSYYSSVAKDTVGS